MSARSKNSKRGNGSKGALDRPFDSEVWKRAEAMVERYQMVLWFEDGEWYGRGVELPGVMADGKTPAACVKEVRFALAVMVATMIERDEKLPPPSSEGLRTEQVYIRLSAEEKLCLESSAKAQGYRGVSDFVRAKALEAAGSH